MEAGSYPKKGYPLPPLFVRHVFAIFLASACMRVTCSSQSSQKAVAKMVHLAVKLYQFRHNRAVFQSIYAETSAQKLLFPQEKATLRSIGQST
jgi:hypothetical protein